MSPSGRKQHRSPDKRSGSDHAHRTSHKAAESEKKPASRGSSENVRSAGFSPHHPEKHASSKAPAKKSLRGKVANFFRGGVRATLGRMIKGGRRTDDTSHASHKPHASHAPHSGKASSSKSHGAHQRHAASAPRHSSHQPHSSHAPAAHEPAVPPPDCRWIADEATLRAFIDEIRGPIEAGGVLRSFIDTEADSLHHYSEKLCLIQLAVDGHFALIDTLALPDLSELLALLDKTEIWLHGADYDLTLLKRTYDWSPHRIYDTQIAARLCGERPFGLAALVERHCGVVLCKSSQKADWSQRPLPAKMQAYAVDDVRYLGRLADILIRNLTDKGRLDWFTQSCATLRRDVLKRPDRDKEDAWRINGSGRLKPAGLAVLKELWLWRDSTAASRDVPPFKVLNNQQLLGMATDFESTGHVQHPPRWRQEWRDGFRAAVARAQESDPSTWPHQPRQKRRHITEAQKDRIEKLCTSRDKKAEVLGIESSLLGSRATLEQVVLQPAEEAQAILMPWQREVLGDV